MFQWLLNKLDMSDPSDFEDYYEDISWKTFRTDDSIWGDKWRRLKVSYFRELQHCYEQLLKEMSNSYLYDVSGIREQFNAMHLRNCTLERDLAIAQGQNEILQRQLTDALKWQTQTGRKNEVLESQGLETIKPTATASKEGNRFTGNSGTSLIENQMLAAAYYENGWSLSEISEELHLAEGSVKVYVSNMQKHYSVRFIQGRKHIIFDSEYGGADWDLALYERLSVKFPMAKESVG